METNIDPRTATVEQLRGDYHLVQRAGWQFLANAKVGDACYTYRHRHGRTRLNEAEVVKVTKTQITVRTATATERYTRSHGDRVGDRGSFSPSYRLVPENVGRLYKALQEEKEAEERARREVSEGIDRLTNELRSMDPAKAAELLKRIDELTK